MLTQFGRIGRPANLPVSFPVDVSLFYVDTNSKAQKLDIEEEIRTAVCYVGRDKDSKSVHRLVLAEQTCDHIQQALHALDDKELDRSARDSLAKVKGDSGFFIKLQHGEIAIPEPRSEQEPTQKSIPIGGQTAAVIIRGGNFGEGSKVESKQKRAAFIIKVTNISQEDAE